MKQYGVLTSRHARKRAWKYRFAGELWILILSRGQPAKSYRNKKAHQLQLRSHTTLDARRGREQGKQAVRTSYVSSCGLLFQMKT